MNILLNWEWKVVEKGLNMLKMQNHPIPIVFSTSLLGACEWILGQSTLPTGFISSLLFYFQKNISDLIGLSKFYSIQDGGLTILNVGQFGNSV